MPDFHAVSYALARDGLELIVPYFPQSRSIASYAGVGCAGDVAPSNRAARDGLAAIIRGRLGGLSRALFPPGRPAQLRESSVSTQILSCASVHLIV